MMARLDDDEASELGWEPRVPVVPGTWLLADFSDAFAPVSVNKNKVPAKSYKPEGLLPIVDQGQAFIAGYTDDESLAIEPGEGLIVFGDHTRAFKRVSFPFAAGADGVKVLRPLLSDSKYAYYACKSLRLPSRGYSRHYSFLSRCKVPIAPENEQRRIVSKIEELFGRIDEGERALEQVQMLVERYHQSVLKAAVTGGLTQEWRAKNKGRSESGGALLARTLKARREIWEKAEAEKSKGRRTAPNAKWKAYAQATPPNTTDLPALPEGWVWASLDQLSCLITSGSRGWSDYYAESGSLFIRAQNIKHDFLDLEDVAYVDLAGVTEGIRTKVAQHDLLVTITGANVTKAARVTKDLEHAFVSQHVALVRPALSDISPFLFEWIVSPANGRADLLSAAYGAGKPGLSLEDLKELAIPLPPLAEQKAITELIEIERSRISSAIFEAKARKSAVVQLRQTILKAAFSGCLVEQDLTDESASHFLERIAVERGAHNGDPKRGRKKHSTA